MALSLVTAPAIEPITVAEALRQLRIDAPNLEPAPTLAPTAALAGAGAGNVDNGAHRYGVSFVTADGETEPSGLSAALTVSDKTVNGKVALTAIPTGGAAVTSRRLYRTTAGGSTLLLLATLADNSTAIYTDNIADASLGVQAPTSNSTADSEVTARITAVRERAELATARAMNTQTWDLVMDAFPDADFIELPKPPLQTVPWVKYLDTSGVLQTWSSSNYVVLAPAGPRARRGRIALPMSGVWPVPALQRGAVQIRFVCGYGATAASVPGLLRQGMLLDLGLLYEQRERVVTGAIATELPATTREIYAGFKSYATQALGA